MILTPSFSATTTAAALINYLRLRKTLSPSSPPQPLVLTTLLARTLRKPPTCGVLQTDGREPDRHRTEYATWNRLLRHS